MVLPLLSAKKYLIPTSKPTKVFPVGRGEKRIAPTIFKSI